MKPVSKQTDAPCDRATGRKEADQLSICEAVSHSDFELARELFIEYSQSLGFSLCFQNFDLELAGLPGKYAPPKGRLLLATCDRQIAGCVALRPLEEGVCEMKRLYLRPQFRGKGLGRVLAERIIQEAVGIGYRLMRLDTVEPMMKDAVALYRRLGFIEIAPYCDNPTEGTLYMEKQL